MSNNCFNCSYLETSNTELAKIRLNNKVSIEFKCSHPVKGKSLNSNYITYDKEHRGYEWMIDHCDHHKS